MHFQQLSGWLVVLYNVHEKIKLSLLTYIANPSSILTIVAFIAKPLNFTFCKAYFSLMLVDAT